MCTQILRYYTHLNINKAYRKKLQKEHTTEASKSPIIAFFIPNYAIGLFVNTHGAMTFASSVIPIAYFGFIC